MWIKVPRSAGSSPRDYATAYGASTSTRKLHPKISGRTRMVSGRRESVPIS
ncbi:hypothetical protein CU044_6341 [Streptomyces sp. L-9-10]|nr:hypothetical protein CU044_6341 [Streptomyces sp. L-9-10]